MFIKGIPIIWIGGFIWGGSLIARSLKNRKWSWSPLNLGAIEKEIITCAHCHQKLRVPKDRQKYTDITCTNCRNDPYLGMFGRLHRGWKKYESILIIGGAVVILALYLIFNKNNSVNAPAVNVPLGHATASSLVVAINSTNTVNNPVVVVPTHIVYFSNGEFLNSNLNYLRGRGELEIKNGTSDSAVAKLVNNITNKSIATVFIEANSNYTLKNISDGSYKLVFNLGHDWDTISKKFTINSSYAVFEDSFDFRTYATDGGNYTDTHYATYEITLNPVIGGTAKTNDINPDEFSNY
ncbi:MAG: hypothetical protein NTV30_07750 [Chloroflexi bacterium]|nr:hypothetical protein [Chloroflexota bacterium]